MSTIAETFDDCWTKVLQHPGFGMGVRSHPPSGGVMGRCWGVGVCWGVGSGVVSGRVVLVGWFGRGECWVGG